MQYKNIELTSLANKEKLSHFIERAQNIFRVVAQNYENDVINLVDDIYLAIKYPLKVSGWDHDWREDEKPMLAEPTIKCMETMEIANDAKKAIANLLKNLNKLHDELHGLSILGEKTEEYINKFAQFANNFKAKIALLEAKSKITRQEDVWLEELKNNLFLLEDSKEALEVVKPGIDNQRDELTRNIEDLADLFLTDEIPLEKIHLQQEVNIIIKLINTLYQDVKDTYVHQSEAIEDLGKLFFAMSERCHELLVVAESIVQSSQELCDKSIRLLQYNPG